MIFLGQIIDLCDSLGAGQTLKRFVDTFRLYCGVTYFLCRLSVTPGDVRALGNPLIGVCGEAPWVVGAVRVAAVVLPEVSATNAQRASTFYCRWHFKVISQRRRHSLAFEVVWKEGVVVRELGVPALANHTLWSDIHGAAVICAFSPNT